MIVLHGSWLPETGSVAARFALWGEVAQLGASPPRPRGRPRKDAGGVGAHPHPFAAHAAALYAAMPVAGLADHATELPIVAQLPTVSGEPLPSRPFLREGAAPRGTPALASWAVTALAFAPADA